MNKERCDNMELVYKQALAEVYDIIEILSFENKSKISLEFKKFVEENRDKNYKSNVKYGISIDKQNIKSETRIFLSYIYREFLCDSDKKIALQKNDEEFLKNKYSVNKIFEKELPKKMIKIEEKEKLYNRILNFFKRIINKE